MSLSRDGHPSEPETRPGRQERRPLGRPEARPITPRRVSLGVRRPGPRHSVPRRAPTSPSIQGGDRSGGSAEGCRVWVRPGSVRTGTGPPVLRVGRVSPRRRTSWDLLPDPTVAPRPSRCLPSAPPTTPGPCPGSGDDLRRGHTRPPPIGDSGPEPTSDLSSETHPPQGFRRRKASPLRTRVSGPDVGPVERPPSVLRHPDSVTPPTSSLLSFL